MSASGAFDTNLLDQPPDDFQMFGVSDAELERDRALNVENYQKIVKHHTWGLKYTILGRKTKGKFFALLKKIVFNQQPHLRAKDWRSFILRDCDAGPGLLELRYNAPPASRKNPKGIRATALPPPVATNQQKDPQVVYQPSNSQSHIGFPTQPQQAPSMNNSLNLSPASQQFSAYLSDFQAANQFHPDMSNIHPNSQSSTTSLAQTETDSELPFIPDLPDIGMPLELDVISNQGNPSPKPIDQPIILNADRRIITEAIEREMLRIAYRGLERHPLAFPIGTLPVLTATSAEDFSAFPVVFPRALRVRLLRNNSGLESRLDPGGALYSYRGRGPVSAPNSSPVDCVIVAGKLLDAGSTIRDRGVDEGWATSLTPVERAFIEATTLNWDVFSKKFSVESRDDFWGLLNGGLNSHKAAEPGRRFHYGESLPPAKLWDVCTTSFQQFRLRYDETLAFCPCRNIGETPSTPLVVSSISPKFEQSDRRGVTMQVLLNRFFEQCEPRTCPVCGLPGDIYIKSFDELPLRLVVKPDPRVLLLHHTSNHISFTYFKHKEKLVGSYRWLGGVYCAPQRQAPRYTVFWTDDIRGETVTGQLCMYDGTQNSGIIVGSIPPYQKEERIPSEWWESGAPPLLFYERVINPSLESLTKARDAVNDMIQTVNTNQMILGTHKPWETTSIPLDGEIPQRGFLNTSPIISLSNCDSGEKSAANRVSSNFETSLPSNPNNEIPRAGQQVSSVQPSQNHLLRSQSQPHAQAGLQNSSTPETRIGPSIQELETDNIFLGQKISDLLSPESHRSSFPQGQQLASIDQMTSSDFAPHLFTDLPLQNPQQQYVPLTDEAREQMLREVDIDLPLRLRNEGKRQRSPSYNFYEADGSGAWPSLKKQRHE